MGLIRITPADRWFSMCVRERAAWNCERCGKHHEPPTQALHCAHWHSRGNWSVRFDPDNALALCYGCHVITGRERETEHRPLMLKTVGDFVLDRLAADKKRPAKGIELAIGAISKHYRSEYARMQDLRSAGVVGRIPFARWER